MKTECKKNILILIVGIFSLTSTAMADRKLPCEPLDKKGIKIEAWIAKRFKKDKKQIKKELGSLGNTKVRLRVFPMKEPAHVVAIGRCVPADIGRHALKNAVKYAGGVESLVYQTILSGNWIGIGTMAFDEYSQNKITPTQLDELLDESLDTPNFQKLVEKFSLPGDTIKVFGAQVPNVRRSEIDPPLRNR